MAPRSRRSARLASVRVTSSGFALDDVAPSDGEAPMASLDGVDGRDGAGAGAGEGDDGAVPLPGDVPAIAAAPDNDPVAPALA